LGFVFVLTHGVPVPAVVYSLPGVARRGEPSHLRRLWYEPYRLELHGDRICWQAPLRRGWRPVRGQYAIEREPRLNLHNGFPGYLDDVGEPTARGDDQRSQRATAGRMVHVDCANSPHQMIGHQHTLTNRDRHPSYPRRSHRPDAPAPDLRQERTPTPKQSPGRDEASQADRARLRTRRRHPVTVAIQQGWR
jgi:hypothetical protein